MTPTVSILLPVFNEASHIRDCLASLSGQDYPAILETLIAEGGSTDGTQEILKELVAAGRRIVIVDNPDRIQSHGLNRLLTVAAGDIAVRADAHTTYAHDYVTKCVAALQSSGAALVGGPMIPSGTNTRERAIAAAMTSPVAVGGARFRRTDAAGEVDTVYLGAATTITLRTHGGYGHLPSGVAEDADLAYRIRRAGGRVVLDPAIRSIYRPRPSFRSLWRQFWRYGRGKAEMLYLHGRLPSWRPLAPLLLIAGLLAGIVVGIAASWWWPLIVLLGMWVMTLAIGSFSPVSPPEGGRTPEGGGGRQVRNDHIEHDVLPSEASARGKYPGGGRGASDQARPQQNSRSTRATSWRSPHPLLTLWAIATMHLSYGLGFAFGLIRGRGGISAAMRSANPSGDAPAGDLHRDPQDGQSR